MIIHTFHLTAHPLRMVASGRSFGLTRINACPYTPIYVTGSQDTGPLGRLLMRGIRKPPVRCTQNITATSVTCSGERRGDELRKAPLTNPELPDISTTRKQASTICCTGSPPKTYRDSARLTTPDEGFLCVSATGRLDGLRIN